MMCVLCCFPLTLALVVSVCKNWVDFIPALRIFSASVWNVSLLYVSFLDIVD